ncbi:beta-Ig-H3/fasciclin [Basidiobolus meristosporus CBS 931.73]|uniref:Beta-Ig-H3/fasciclin n=1 Tax=Basidiobolus meristosporus CBS 931.73 TaxID=1314790 RepID=A0A1Y1YK78_9FUNG|nr:beta-Ig-H3/fasciclin [Basidiobolus meristosporus CBS 931.73]|eukprot:ORX98411.1 beta-Ig-H3/fasciclin [Basidiobolus meristosporus CBS 931.73]
MPKLYGTYEDVEQDGKPTLGDYIPGDKSLTIFMDALRQFPDLVDQVYNPNLQLTILAPTNSAFQKLNISEHVNQLHEIVASHIIPKAISREQFGSQEFVTLSSRKIHGVSSDHGTTFENHSNLKDDEKHAVNGYLYKIDQVLI